MRRLSAAGIRDRQQRSLELLDVDRQWNHIVRAGPDQ